MKFYILDDFSWESTEFMQFLDSTAEFSYSPLTEVKIQFDDRLKLTLSIIKHGISFFLELLAKSNSTSFS